MSKKAIAPTQPTDADMLAFFRSCENAKPFRAAMIHYVKQRDMYGTDVPMTSNAELHAYRQAAALVEEVQGKLRKGRK